MEDILFKGYNALDWMLDRVFDPLFIADQCFGFDDRYSPEFMATVRLCMMRYGYDGFHP